MKGLIEVEPAIAYPGDDALDARWFDLDSLDKTDVAMSFGVRDVALQAYAVTLGDIPSQPHKT